MSSIQIFIVIHGSIDGALLLEPAISARNGARLAIDVDDDRLRLSFLITTPTQAAKIAAV